MSQLRIFYYWLRSFSKTTWTIDDYPVRVRPNGGEEPGFVAQILNWPGLVGLGTTEEEARADLATNLASRDPLPRPGTSVPISFASSDRVEAHGAFAYEFLEEVTGITPMFISDGTTLATFASDDAELATFLERIKERYGVDVSDLVEEPLPAIYDRVRGW